jgi:hypothetical protein
MCLRTSLTAEGRGSLLTRRKWRACWARCGYRTESATHAKGGRVCYRYRRSRGRRALQTLGEADGHAKLVGLGVGTKL